MNAVLIAIASLIFAVFGVVLYTAPIWITVLITLALVK